MYIVLGPLCWGKGKTIKEARKNAKANWPCRLMSPAVWRETIYQVPADSWVDDMGTLKVRRGKSFRQVAA